MKSIMYHYIRPDDKKYPAFKNLSVDNFEKQLEYFGNEFGFINEKEFKESLLTTTPKKGVVLTFDDGLSDHYEFVYPILKRNNIWGIFYINFTPIFNNSEIDVHSIHIILGKRNSKDVYQTLEKIITTNMLIDKNNQDFRNKTYSTQNNDEYTKLVKRILNYYISYEYRNEIINELFDAMEIDKAKEFSNYYLHENQILEMHNNGFCIGNHTSNHPVLSKLDKDSQDEEISQGFEYLNQLFQNKYTKTFCFPYGGFHSFNEDTLEILNKNNCEFAFNVEHRDINSEDLNNKKLFLPRYDCNQFPFGSVNQKIYQ